MKVPDITVDNFMERLDNGVIVCKLAKLIEVDCNLVLPNVPLLNGCKPILVSNKHASQQMMFHNGNSTTPPNSNSRTTTPTLNTPGKQVWLYNFCCLEIFINSNLFKFYINWGLLNELQTWIQTLNFKVKSPQIRHYYSYPSLLCQLGGNISARFTK